MKVASSVYCRYLERGKKFYAKYYGGDGKIFRTITLKATTKVKAVVEAKQHLDQGILSQTNNPYVIDFYKKFLSSILYIFGVKLDKGIFFLTSTFGILKSMFS